MRPYTNAGGKAKKAPPGVSVRSPQAYRRTQPGTGGDKPRPYEKSGSVSVGADFISARGSGDFPSAFPGAYTMRPYTNAGGKAKKPRRAAGL